VSGIDDGNAAGEPLQVGPAFCSDPSWLLLDALDGDEVIDDSEEGNSRKNRTCRTIWVMPRSRLLGCPGPNFSLKIDPVSLLAAIIAASG
jgi:hypothetical protein